jgi:hypothetical protein
VVKVAIVGSRHYPDLSRVADYVGSLPASSTVVTGSAAAERNQRLIDACDVLVAFWDGASNGTRQTIDRALASGREVHVFTPTRVDHPVGARQASP